MIQYVLFMWYLIVTYGVMRRSITSFNEWGEGTQIEAARDYLAEGQSYLTYGSLGPYGYIKQSAKYALEFKGLGSSHSDL